MSQERQEKIVLTLPPETRESPAGRLRRLFGRAAAPGTLQVSGGGNWKKSIPFSKATAAAILTRDLPPGTHIELELKAGGKGRLKMTAAGIFRSMDSSNEGGRAFDIGAGTAEKGRTLVESDRQSGGTGRRVLRNEIEFLRACGVKRFNIHAGYDAGGYAWARFGFVPDNRNDANFRVHTKKPVQQRYAAFRPYLEEQDRAVLDAAVEFRDDRDLWRIADRDRDIGPGLRRIFGEIAAAKAAKTDSGAKAGKTDLSAAASQVQALFETGWGFCVLNHVQAQLAAGKKVTAGQLLLAGTAWQGHLDLDDAAQMRRAGDYAGGWKYIGFAPAGPKH